MANIYPDTPRALSEESLNILVRTPNLNLTTKIILLKNNRKWSDLIKIIYYKDKVNQQDIENEV